MGQRVGIPVGSVCVCTRARVCVCACACVSGCVSVSVGVEGAGRSASVPAWVDTAVGGAAAPGSQEVGLPHHEAGRASAAPAAVQGPVHEVEVALGLAPQQVALDAVWQRLVGQLEAAAVHQHEEPVVLRLHHLELLRTLGAQRLSQRVRPRRQRPRLLLRLQIRHADEVLRGETEGVTVTGWAKPTPCLNPCPDAGSLDRTSCVALSSLGPPIPLHRQRMDGRRGREAGRRGTCG